MESKINRCKDRVLERKEYRKNHSSKTSKKSQNREVMDTEKGILWPYGLGNRWGRRSKLDPTLFVWKKKERIIGIMVTHVDDLCFGGD